MPKIPENFLNMSTEELKNGIDNYDGIYGGVISQLTQDVQEAWISRIWGMTAFMFWLTPSTSDPAGQTNIRSGSAFVVQTPMGYFGVTAGHVYDSYLKAREQNSKVRCHLGRNTNVIFDLKDRLISRGRGVDIATFFVKSREISQISIRPINQWPPLIPERNDLIVLGGYPGADRSHDPGRKLDFGLFSHVGIVSDIHNTRLTCSLDLSRCHGRVPPSSYPTGGMSGGPVMAMLNYWDLDTWHLAGVICEGVPAFDVLFAERADLIRANGSISGGEI